MSTSSMSWPSTFTVHPAGSVSRLGSGSLGQLSSELSAKHCVEYNAENYGNKHTDYLYLSVYPKTCMIVIVWPHVILNDGLDI